VDTSPNPSERFLARALRHRSNAFEPIWDGVKRALLFLVRIAAVVAIAGVLLLYVWYCVTIKCDKADCAAKAAGTTAASPERRAESPEAGTTAGTSEPKYAWVQLMPDEKNTNTPGGRLVRTIGPERGSCPTITQGGNSFRMYQRPPSARTAFPILLCEFVLIENTEARIGSIVLAARPDEPNDIVVLGDTGCRMVYWQIQPCRVPDRWPFARVAENAASKVVAGKSFILHLGDFHYREDPCIDSSTDCGTSPFGDIWDTWKAEFFEPARELLRAAPWVIMRGNHEDCARAGAGWIFLFGLPGQYDSRSACDDDARMYRVSIGATDERPSRPRILVVMDTSDEKNPYRIKDNCKQYQMLLGQIEAEEPERASRELWLAMHQPLWGRNMQGKPESIDRVEENVGPWNYFRAANEAFDCGETESPLAVFRDKFDRAKDKRIARLVLAGDTHAFQFFWPTADFTPIQIIAGNGGTKLDELRKKDPTSDKFVEDKDPPVVIDVTSWGIAGKNLTLVQHGFTIMRRLGTTWSATQLDRDGTTMAVCQFSEALSAAPSDLPNCNDIRSTAPPSN
jgi:hypothetical protein